MATGPAQALARSVVARLGTRYRRAYAFQSLRAAGVRLALGKLADDPFTLPPDRLAGAQVAATLVGGEVVHGALK